MSAGYLIAASAHRNRDLKGDAGPGDHMLGSSASLDYKVAYAKRLIGLPLCVIIMRNQVT